MRTEKERQQKNRGFTLVEMIVTVAIIAIFSGVVVTAVSVGSNLYRNVSSSTRVQVDTQQLLDEMENLIIDANRSVYYANGSGSALGSPISDDIDSSASGDKTFLVCNEYENGDGSSRYIVDVLDWVESEEKVYYSQRQFTADSSDEASGNSGTSSEAVVFSEEDGAAVQDAGEEGTGEDSTEAIVVQNVRDGKNLVERSVYAEGIKNFRADVSAVVSERIVRFQLTTENHGKMVNTLHTVNLRNQIQVMKPDDAFADADATDVSISIVGVPESMDAGTSVVLGYALTGTGSIDPTTLVWKVEDGDGSFPTDSDPTYGKLTASASGTKTIKVTVSAKKADGSGTVISAPVYIKINNKNPEKTVTGIQADQDTILIGAGNSLDLNTAVNWKALYSDGSTGTDSLSVNWSLESDAGFATLGAGGQLSIQKNAGTAENGSFSVTASYEKDGNRFSGKILIKVARIDLTGPADGATYQVGDTKPLSYIYREGGQEVTGVQASITTAEKPDGAQDYLGQDTFATGTFETADVGDWKLRASVDVTTRGGYGTVESSSAFKVEAGTKDEYISEPGICIAVGNTYACSDYHGYGFRFISLKDDTSYHDITWSIEGNFSSGTTITADGKNAASISVGSDERAFILKATCKKYKNANLTDLIGTVVVEKPVSVAYKAEISDELPDTVKPGETYPMAVNITYGNISRKSDGTYEYTDQVQRVQNGEDGTTITWDGNESPNVKNNGLNQNGSQWTAPEDWANGSLIQARGTIRAFPGAFYGTHAQYLVAEKMVTLKVPQIKVEIKARDAETKEDLSYGAVNETIEFYVVVTIDGESTEEYQVEWWQSYFSDGNTPTENNRTFLCKNTWAATIPVTVAVKINGKKYNEEIRFSVK